MGGRCFVSGLTNLREQLGLTGDPEFVIDLPAGWSRRDVNSGSEELLLASLKNQFMKAHQPQMYGPMKRLVSEAFEGMKKSGAIAFYAPLDAPKGTLLIPVSIVARVRRAEGGASLDSYVRTLIQQRSAEPLFDDARILRYEEKTEVRIEGEIFNNSSTTYLSPIPGSARKRAVEFVGSVISHPRDENADMISAQQSLVDICVRSLRWRVAKN